MGSKRGVARGVLCGMPCRTLVLGCFGCIVGWDIILIVGRLIRFPEPRIRFSIAILSLRMSPSARLGSLTVDLGTPILFLRILD